VIRIGKNLNTNILVFVDAAIAIIIFEVAHFGLNLTSTGSARTTVKHDHRRCASNICDVGEWLFAARDKIRRKQDVEPRSYVELTRHTLIFLRTAWINQECRDESSILLRTHRDEQPRERRRQAQMKGYK